MEKIFVFGHQKPDTDSVTSAIALAYLKNKLGKNVEPKILGDINKETKYVLDYFNEKEPSYLDNVKLQLKDINYYHDCYVNQYKSLEYTYNYLIENQITGVPVVDDNNKLLGIVTIKDLMYKVKNLSNAVKTNYDNIVSVLSGKSISRVSDEIKGNVVIKDNKLYIYNNESIELIITDDINFNNQYETNVIYTTLDLVTATRYVIWSNYVKDVISGDRFYKFTEDDYYDDFVRETKKLRYNNYPIVNRKNKCLGLIRITDITEKNNKKVILVDHNEIQQSVEGLDEANIVEVIDHHKIGAISTNTPISFRNMAVGSTNTIIYSLFIENNIEIPKNIAGLMLSGILSDTIGLTSATTTDIDKSVVNKLSSILDIDYNKYYFEMLKAGTSVEGLTKEDVLKQDLKYFQINDKKYAVSQILTLDVDSILKDKEEYIKIINNQKEVKELNLMLFVITDAIKQGSYLLYTDGIEEMIKNIYNLNEVYQGVFVPNLTSRKKQIIPYFTEYLN